MSTKTQTPLVQPGGVQRSDDPNQHFDSKHPRPETTETLWVRLFDGKRDHPVFYPGAVIRWVSRDNSVGRPYQIYIAVLGQHRWHITGAGKLANLLPMTTETLISTLHRLEIADGDLDVLSGGWPDRDL